MIVYITRHGQVLAKEYYGDVMYPAGDLPLTPLGRRQAQCLAEHLRSLGFRGRIAASPYRRTAETADIIASALGLGVTLLPCLREIMKTEAGARDFRGMSLAELHALFPTTRETKSLPFPWWTENMDTQQDVARRVKEGLEAFLPTVKERELLLVGHGASCGAMHRSVFKIERKCHDVKVNCGLSMWNSETGEQYSYCAGHLPRELITSNALTYEEMQRRRETAVVQAAEFAARHPGPRLLHIGDTAVYAYDYYRELIAAAKPAIIVHTGDLADEYKAGRREEDRSGWLEGAGRMVSMLRESGARILAVPGNNDPAELLRTLAPDFEIVPSHTVTELGGRRICLCHEPPRIDEEADQYFYGHTLNGEARTPEANESNGKRYFNCMWGSSIHDLQSGEAIIVYRPKF